MAFGGRPKETTPETALGEFIDADCGGRTTPLNSRMRGKTNSTRVLRNSYMLGPLRSTLTPTGMPGRIHPPTAFLPLTSWMPSTA